MAGPFTVVPTPMNVKLDLPELALPGEVPTGKPAGRGPPPLLTHFGPPEARALVEHAGRFVPLVVAQYEAVLGSRLPFPSLQQVRRRQRLLCACLAQDCCLRHLGSVSA